MTEDDLFSADNVLGLVMRVLEVLAVFCLVMVICFAVGYFQ